tara:strand:- start:435 stop:773 length:339 start_codon:yes stop_codon:yes gene_type:complete
MRDPTIPSAKNRKKIMFYDSPDRQTKLKIRCDFDGVTQSQFFRMMITGYIENDEYLYRFIKKYKEDNQLQGSQKINKLHSIKSKSQENQSKFSLNENEIENIFDVIEVETGL